MQGQDCTNLGQNPGTAFPVCGSAVFIQNTVTICGGKIVPGPCTVVLKDVNPYWYKFTCFTAGTLGFTIIPNTNTDDYDWQIFDVTGKDPATVYTDVSLFVVCNWSGETGTTGADSTGTSFIECAGPGVPLFSKMPTLILGHDYLLLVSHFTQSQSGYSLTFKGGTASITDPVPPHLFSAKAACDGKAISIKINKKIKCSSIDADGSDFKLYSSLAPTIPLGISSATGIGCTNGFDTDSLSISSITQLPPGNYKITVRPVNNLLDNCDNYIPATDTLFVPVYPVIATPMDSLSPVKCAPNVLQLVFRDNIRCNSIAADGSDFIVTGSPAITISSASGICTTTGVSPIIQVTLSAPIKTAGNYTITLKQGNDGNTIINECGKETPAGESINFTTADTVSAAFKTITKLGCNRDTIQYTYTPQISVNSWKWNFNNLLTSNTALDTSITYPLTYQAKTVLIVSNGTCSDTASTSITLDNAIKAAFEGTNLVCPGDPATFVDKTISSLSNTWAWNFGNGNTSTQQAPNKQYYPSSNDVHEVPVQLIVTNAIGCSDSATNFITVVGNCYIAIPKAFTPNGDGLNDYLYPTNAYKAKDLYFSVYNRAGQKLFETRDWTNKWDGTYNGTPQDIGTYVWILTYTNIDTGKRINLKGTTVLIR